MMVNRFSVAVGRYRQPLIGLSIAILSLSGFVGCTPSYTHGTVEGTITLDEAPLVEGVVRFVPVERSLQTASAAIVDGKFSTEVALGTYRVEFSAPKVTGKRKMYDTPDSPEVDVVSELLPERYNVKSELQIVVEVGVNEYAEDLKSE